MTTKLVSNLGSSLRVNALALLVMMGLAWGQQPAPASSSRLGTAFHSQDRSPTSAIGMTSSAFDGLALRSLGPASISGRVTSLAVRAGRRSEYYAAFAAGGVWKTVNAGATWTPIFDSQGSYSIGCLALDPFDTNTLWVGTGEAAAHRSVSYGDGVYKSTDAGKTWSRVGLPNSEHISRIAIDPRDSKTVYVAAEGALWGPGGDRGIFKTTDGGQTWRNLLAISDNTGFSDIAIDPGHPDTLYAAAYQRRRHVWTVIDGGPESALYKSTDAGATWTKLRNGLPNVNLGRIGLSISPADPDVVYAIVEAAEGLGGIYRSSDAGVTWERRNSYDNFQMFFGTIVADPKNVDRIYLPNAALMVSEDGGRTLKRLGEKVRPHVDAHVIWIDPLDTDYYLAGTDGGVYESLDRGSTWMRTSNFATGQFYEISADNSLPFYRVYGGTQDNETWGGPVRTRDEAGITAADWEQVRDGDGFHTAVDPVEPNIVYAEGAYGDLTRFDRATGQLLSIAPPQPAGLPYRFNWDAPFLLSSHDRRRLYLGGNVVFRSDDRGGKWQVVSPDLTRQINRNQLPVMGTIWGPEAVAKHASTAYYGNVVSLSESPLDENLLYAGTDDGLIQVTSDGGRRWTKYESFPSVPSQASVSAVLASRHNPQRVYACFDNHQNSDFRPYIFVSNDQGRSWRSISAGLPLNGPVLTIVEDTVDPELLFVGTEFGLWFSGDAGSGWTRLKGGLPTIAVRALTIQPRESDLVVATFGRGLFVLDDLSPLRKPNRVLLGNDFAIFPVKNSLLYVETTVRSSRQPATANPPFGAIFTYYIGTQLESQRGHRLRQERLQPSNDGASYPDNDKLRDEAAEEPPSIFFLVYDDHGAPVRRIDARNEKGLHRTSWDLRYPDPVLASTTSSDLTQPPPQGAFVAPGRYSVRMFTTTAGKTKEVTEPRFFDVVVEPSCSFTAEQWAQKLSFDKDLDELFREVARAVRTAEEARGHLGDLQQGHRDVPDWGANQEISQLRNQLHEVLARLKGDDVLAAHHEPAPESIQRRLSILLSNSQSALEPPTETERSEYGLALDQYRKTSEALGAIVHTAIPELERKLDNSSSVRPPQ